MTRAGSSRCIEIGGQLPRSAHGGQLGEANLHGTSGIAEAARQVRGTAAHPVSGLEQVVVTAGTRVPTVGRSWGVHR